MKLLIIIFVAFSFMLPTLSAQSRIKGIAYCGDAPFRVEIIDTIPSRIEWNKIYRVTHYIRNFSQNYLFLYYLERKVEYSWDNGQGMGSGEEFPPLSYPDHLSARIPSGASCVSSVEGSFGNLDSSRVKSVEPGYFLAFTNAHCDSVPHTLRIRFSYNFRFTPDGDIHTIVMGWKTLHINAPNHAM